MRAACTMSRSIDPRRPRRLTSAQSASVNDDPTIRLLLDQREELRRSLQHATKDPKYQALNRAINQEKQRGRHKLLQDVKKRWEYEQPVRDVEQQLAGIEPRNDLEGVHMDLLPAQKELVDAILAPVGRNLEEEIRRRNKAIRAVTRYCGIEEGGMHPSQQKRMSGRFTPPDKGEDDARLDPDEEALEAAKVAVYKETRPRICFVCLGNKKLPTEWRIYPFYSSGDLTRHFKRKHLQHIKEGDQLGCKLCQVPLKDKMHLQRHADDVHGTVS
jgi:hypothetical protein